MSMNICAGLSFFKVLLDGSVDLLSLLSLSRLFRPQIATMLKRVALHDAEYQP